jgi:glutathione S-transferase
MIIEGFNRFHNEFFGFFVSKGLKEGTNKHFSTIIVEIEEYLVSHKKHNKPWLLGRDSPSMADLYLFPFLERIVLMEDTPWRDTFFKLDVKDHAPAMFDFVHRFREIPQFKEQILIP